MVAVPQILILTKITMTLSISASFRVIYRRKCLELAFLSMLNPPFQICFSQQHILTTNFTPPSRDCSIAIDDHFKRKRLATKTKFAKTHRKNPSSIDRRAIMDKKKMIQISLLLFSKNKCREFNNYCWRKGCVSCKRR